MAATTSSDSSSDSEAPDDSRDKMRKKEKKNAKREKKEKKKAKKKDAKRKRKEEKKQKKAEKRRKLSTKPDKSEGKWVMIDGESVFVPTEPNAATWQKDTFSSKTGGGSDEDSDFEWGASSGGISREKRSKLEGKKLLHKQKALAMQRVDENSATWREYAAVRKSALVVLLIIFLAAAWCDRPGGSAHCR